MNRFLKKLSDSLVDVMVSHVEKWMMVIRGNSNFTPIKEFGGERELKNVAFINWKPDEILIKSVVGILLFLLAVVRSDL